MSSVTDLAALAGVVAGDGDQVFVQTLKDNFILDVASTLTPDGITIIAATGGGNWLRMNIAHPSWRLGRYNWHIDPTNGDDENDGLTAATAIASGAEHTRRWGRQNRVQQIGSSDFSVHIYIYGNLLKPDALSIDCVLAGDTELMIERDSATTSYSGTASAITAENQAAGTAWAMTDTSASLVQGQRVRWTSGAANGATAFVAKTLVASTQWRISQTYLDTAASFGVVPVAKTPAANDTYVIDTLPRVNFGPMRVLQEGNSIDFGVNVYFKDLQIDGPPGTLHCINCGPTPLNQVQLVFYGCLFSTEIESYGCYFANCAFAATPVFRKPSYVYGGLVYGSTTLLEWQAGEEGQLTLNIYVQGTRGVLAAGSCVIGNIGIFDSVTGGGTGLTGDGLVVGSPGNGGNAGPAIVRLTGRVWGAGNAGAGIHVRSGSRAVYEIIPTITGAADFQLGATTTNAFYYSAATGTYLPLTGQACTWVLLAAAAGAPGYGGSAHEPTSDAHVLAAA